MRLRDQSHTENWPKAKSFGPGQPARIMQADLVNTFRRAFLIYMIMLFIDEIFDVYCTDSSHIEQNRYISLS